MASDPWSFAAFGFLLTLLTVLLTAMVIYAWGKGLLRAEGPAKLETLQRALAAVLFASSIPLSFVLVQWTPMLYFLSYPLELAVKRLQAAGRLKL